MNPGGSRDWIENEGRGVGLCPLKHITLLSGRFSNNIPGARPVFTDPRGHVGMSQSQLSIPNDKTHKFSRGPLWVKEPHINRIWIFSTT